MNNRGFTLIEVVLVAGILAFCITSMIRLFIYTSVQADIARNKSAAVGEAQSKIEEIRNNTFDEIATDYASGGTPGNSFSLSSITGLGRIYIDNNATYITNTNAEILGIMIVVSWQNKYGRIIGEDQDLDGILDAGEDANGNGRLDSPVTLMSMVTRR